jgi:hypothetical protein
MSNWKYTLNLSDIWKKYPDEMTIAEMGKEVGSRLKKLSIKFEKFKS